MTKDTYQAHGLTHTVLALLLMTLLIAGSFWVLHPFLTAMIWAAMIVVATWPFMTRLQSALWDKRILAVTYTLLDAWVTGNLRAGTEDASGGKEITDTEE